MSNKKYIICSCSERKLLPKNQLFNTVSALKFNETNFEIINDLCFSAAKEPDYLKQLFIQSHDIMIIACYERAVQSLCKFANINDNIKTFNLRTNNFNDFLKQENLQLHNNQMILNNYDDKWQNWSAWYPCIDYNKCINCKKCVDFCMFSVYSLDDNDKVIVNQPENCKDNCPACARMCPKTAIIFPKHDKSPINGGVELEETNLAVEPKVLYKNIQEELAKR